MQRKFETLATETADYNGVIQLTVRVVREDTDILGNGDYKKGDIRLSYHAVINGKNQAMVTGMRLIPEDSDMYAKGAVARIGDQYIGQKAYDSLIPAVDAAKSNPEYVAQQQAKADAVKAEAEYQDYVKAVDDMMTLGGKTY